MEKIDPYNTKEKYLKWKQKALKEGISGLTNANSQIIMQYLQDMEQGLNVASTNKKGARSPLRLRSLSIKMIFIAKTIQKVNSVDLIDLEEQHLFSLFTNMRDGVIKRKDGNIYKNVGDYVKDFKAFWHWHQKVHRKKGLEIKDITLDLDTSKDKPKWVYLTEEQVRSLCANAGHKYEVLIWFLFDTGIRAPTELLNVKVSDFHNDFKELNIREEVSKTFGRRVKLMLCSSLVKSYVKQLELKPEDYLFPASYKNLNVVLKRLAKRVLGDGISPAGQKYSDLTMYDFRHNSCCYWLPRYKSESALKYRFGWKKSEKIHYYSELLGMKDTISEDDMLVDLTKTEIENRITKSEQEKVLMKEEMADMRNQLLNIGKITKQIFSVLSDEQKAVLIRDFKSKL
jgi:hypothetical protein